VQGTVSFRILFPREDAEYELELIGYSYSNGAMSRMTEKALLATCFSLGKQLLARVQRRNLWWLSPLAKQNTLMHQMPHVK